MVGGTNFLNGMMCGWTAVLPKLQEDTRFTVTEDDVSWLGDCLHFYASIIGQRFVFLMWTAMVV